MSKYRSVFEEDMVKAFKRRKIDFKYETETLKYKKPETVHNYKPDFIFKRKDGHKIYIETKGLFTAAMRKKMVLVIAQHPDKDIRIIFQRAENPLINKKNRVVRKDGTMGDSATYGEWCDKAGIAWRGANTVHALGEILKEWYNEVY